MIRRVITALILAPIAVALILLLPEVLFAGVLMLFLVLGLVEWEGLTTQANKSLIITVVSYLIACGLILLIWGQWIAVDLPNLIPGIFIAGTCFWLLQVVTLMKGIDYRRTANTELALGLLAIFSTWVAMIWLRQQGPGIAYTVLIAIIIVWAADTFAYIAGKSLGRHKLVPSISPGKTIEGVVGGMLGAIVIAWIGARFLLVLEQRQVVAWLLAAVAAAGISVVGDLYVSRLKRQAGVKDTGKLLPGHGGILDRIDGLIAAMPVFASVWWLLK